MRKYCHDENRFRAVDYATNQSIFIAFYIKYYVPAD